MKTKEESIKEIFDRTKELMHGYVDKMTNRMETAIRESYNAGYRAFEKEKQSEYQRGFTEGFACKVAAHDESVFDNNYKVGDEVIVDNGTACFVITSIDGTDVCGINSKGGTYAYFPHDICYKTGRHFDVEGFLKKMEQEK